MEGMVAIELNIGRTCVLQIALLPRNQICLTKECAQYPQAPRVSTHSRTGRSKVMESEKEYLQILLNSAEFASQQAPLLEINRLDGG